jgi:zinc finger BED domain-containing protein 4
MLQRLNEQRQALTVYAGEVSQCPPLPSSNQWSLIEKANSLLDQFSTLTKDFSYANACNSSVIPTLAALPVFLMSDETVAKSSGLNTMRQELVTAMKTRFQHVYATNHYVIATALDPRYKFKYFTSTSLSFATPEILKMICTPSQHPPASTSSDDQYAEGEPPEKQPVRGYWDCFSLSEVTGTVLTWQQPHVC